MKAYLLVGRPLSEVVTDDVKIVFDHIPQRHGICQFKQHVVDGTQIYILHPMFVHMFQHFFVLHLPVNSPVTSRSQTDLSLTLENDFSLVAKSRDAALGEEHNRVLVVSEVFVLLEVVDNLVVVHFAGHEVPLDQRALFVVFLAC